MTQNLHIEALKILKNINTLTISAKPIKKGDVTRIEYKHELIPMGNLTMIVSGSMQNYTHENYHETSRDLFIAIWDDVNEKNLNLTSDQLYAYKKEVRRILVNSEEF